MIENGLEFLDSWCDSPMVEDEELAEQSQIEQKLEVETESLKKVTVPRFAKDATMEMSNLRKWIRIPIDLLTVVPED
ncbi:hypothetical protein Bca4012_082724 [Brassica carinata]